MHPLKICFIYVQFYFNWPLSSDIRYFVITVFLINIFCLLPAFHESSLKSSQRNAFDGKREGEIAALLSNHLLSCLVYGNKYLISSIYHKQPSQCPCLNPIQCMEHIPYGETGLGKLSLLHLNNIMWDNLKLKDTWEILKQLNHFQFMKLTGARVSSIKFLGSIAGKGHRPRVLSPWMGQQSIISQFPAGYLRGLNGCGHL